MSFNAYVHIVDTKGKLQSSASPSHNNDLVTKSYVDSQITTQTEANTYWQEPVEDILATPPGSPTSGDRYLIASSGATGDWAGDEDKVAEWDGSAWVLTAAEEGQALWVKDADENRVYNGSDWVLMSSISGAVPLTKIGSAVGDLSSTAKILETKSGTSLAAGDLLTIDANAKIDKATAIPSSLLSDATTSAKGIIQVGDGLNVSNGVLSVDAGTDADKILRAGENLSDGDILAITDDGGLKVKGATSAQLRTAIGAASTSATGVASFSSDDFTVTGAGAVSVDTGMGSNQIVESSESLTDGSILKAQSGEYDSSTTNAQLSGNYSEGSGFDTSYNSTTGKYDVVFENVSFSSGSFSTISVGDVLAGSGYSFTITALDSSNDEISTESDDNYHEYSTIMSPTIHPAQVQGIANASAANIADACRDASTSAKGVASFSSDDFSVSSGAVSLKRLLINNLSSGIPTSITSPSSYGDLKQFYCFDLSGASSTATLTLPNLANAGLVGRQIEVAVLDGMSSTNALTIAGGNDSNGNAQQIDGLASVVISQDYQVLKLLVVKDPSGSSADQTVFKIV